MSNELQMLQYILNANNPSTNFGGNVTRKRMKYSSKVE